MARDGLIQGAMDRLVKHLGTLETALTGLIGAAAETPDVANTEEAVHDLLEDIQKYIKVGIWLCQGQTRSAERGPESTIDRRKSAYGEVRESDLARDELLLYGLSSSTHPYVSSEIRQVPLQTTTPPSHQQMSIKPIASTPPVSSQPYALQSNKPFPLSSHPPPSRSQGKLFNPTMHPPTR
jgi:hypothetical protein